MGIEGATQPEITIRRATPADRVAIRRILASVWGDGDYVQDLLPEWTQDRRGGLWMALLDGRPAGIGKLTVFRDGQAWLHGLRVARWARRRGVGTALLRHRLDRARALGARVARLDTHHSNLPVLRMARRVGMRRIATVTFWRARARAGIRPARATLEDLPRLWRIAREASRRGPVFARDPRARQLLDRDLLAQAIRRGWCLKIDRPRTAFALISEGERLYVQTLVGPADAVRALLESLRAEAAARHLTAVGVNASPLLGRTVRSAGYQPWGHGRMVILEKTWRT